MRSTDQLLFKDIVNLFSKRRDKRDLAFVKQAKKDYFRDGEIEIDNDAIVSRGMSKDDGGWVMAWVWVTGK